MGLVGIRRQSPSVALWILRTALVATFAALWAVEMFALQMSETIAAWTMGTRMEGTERIPLLIHKFLLICDWNGPFFWASAIFVTVFLVPFVWQLLFAPLTLAKPLEETEAAPTNMRKRRARAGNQLPSPYPTGWFCVMVQADQLKAGQVEEISLFGHTFALFRGWDKKVRMMDAFCTHLGASLAIGGIVEPSSNCLRCPFHGWEFDGSTGRCVKIPYSDHDTTNVAPSSSSSASAAAASTVPKQAHSRAWPVVEAQNMIYAYYDETWARSEDKRSLEDMETAFPCPVIDVLNGSTKCFVYHGHSVHQVAAHIQEIPENGADVAHLNILHKNFFLQALSPFVTHLWTADWRPGKAEDGTIHQAFIHLTQCLRLLNGRFYIPGTMIDVTITQDGPGIVYLFFQTPVGRLYVMETVTPISSVVQQATHTIWAESHVPRFVAKIILWGLVKQFERDIPIWNNKTFLRKPVIVKGDGPITKFRHWYSQFYPDLSSSPSSSSSCSVLDW